MSTAASRARGVHVRDTGSLYFHMALVCAAVSFLGFAPTYWAPMWLGRLTVDPVLHIHAVVFFSWAVLLVVQIWLAASRRIAAHRSLGMLAISLATAMTIFGVMAAINRMHAAEALNQRVAGLAFSIVPLGGITFFAIVFALAIANVRRPELHKRLMLLASISILDAPIARWFVTLLAPEAPPGPPPVAIDIGPSAVALLLLAIPMFADWRRYGHVHSVYWIGGGAYVVWKLLQGPISATPQWHAIAAWIMSLGG